jgi:hypothetical protein
MFRTSSGQMQSLKIICGDPTERNCFPSFFLESGMLTEFWQRVVSTVESHLELRPSLVEFEVAYQARGKRDLRVLFMKDRRACGSSHGERLKFRPSQEQFGPDVDHILQSRFFRISEMLQGLLEHSITACHVN